MCRTSSAWLFCCVLLPGTVLPRHVRAQSVPALHQSHEVNYESTAFSSPHWPACCNANMSDVYPCLFRIPLTISVGSVVLAFAEGRPGLAQSSNPCQDGSGRSIWMRRSINFGRSWDSAPAPVVHDTDPWHAALNDGIVIGAAVHERTTNCIFLFYTTCYHRCSFPGSSLRLCL